jgi:hypothetical protein
MLRLSRGAEQLAAAQEGRISMELVTYLLAYVFASEDLHCLNTKTV